MIFNLKNKIDFFYLTDDYKVEIKCKIENSQKFMNKISLQALLLGGEGKLFAKSLINREDVNILVLVVLHLKAGRQPQVPLI